MQYSPGQPAPSLVLRNDILELPKKEGGMISRRQVIVGSAALSAGVNGFRVGRAFGQNITSPNFVAPPQACDSHQHIIGDPARYPMLPTRPYTPPQASLAELQALHQALHIQRAVLVQPSFYGTDNSCLLDSLKTLGAAGRGIVVIDDETTEFALDEMHKLGVRGVRVNQTGGTRDPAALKQVIESVAARIGHRGWHVQTFLPLTTIATLSQTFAHLPTPVVFDHFGGAKATGTAQSGFDALIALLRDGNCFTKLSRPYQESKQASTYADMAPLAQALVEARADRLLWGSDWPHTNSEVPPGRGRDDINPFYQVDNGNLFNQIPVWIPSEAARQQILSDTPARLFQF